MSRRKRPVTGGMPERQFWEALETNKATWVQYYNRLVSLSVAMFEWTNLPETVDPRYLELALFADGKAVFFKDEVIGYLGLRIMNSGVVDIYNIPIQRVAYAANGFKMQLNRDDSVIIYNNFLRTNSVLDCEMYAKRLDELDRTIDVNVKSQKTPILISCDESQRLTMKNLYMKYDGNEPFIFGDKGINPNSLKAINTEAPYVADKLYTLKTQYWNEALTYLGISNVNTQKKERLISDEVSRQQGGVIANRYSRLEARRQACEKINKMFGLDIWVNYREDYREMDDELMLSGDTEDGKAVIMVEDIRTRTPISDSNVRNKKNE